MSRGMRVVVDTPFGENVLEGVVYLRLEGSDGYLGVQPGHEAALTVVRPGAVSVQSLNPQAQESFLATEGGFAVIQPDEVRLVSRWAVEASDLDELLELLRERFRQRAHVEREVRAQLQRHDVATRRALVGLQREVTR